MRGGEGREVLLLSSRTFRAADLAIQLLYSTILIFICYLFIYIHNKYNKRTQSLLQVLSLALKVGNTLHNYTLN